MENGKDEEGVQGEPGAGAERNASLEIVTPIIEIGHNADGVLVFHVRGVPPVIVAAMLEAVRDKVKTQINLNGERKQVIVPARIVPGGRPQ